MVGTFKVGDRVRMIKSFDGFYDKNNCIATIVDDSTYSHISEVGCVFDKPDGYLHDLGGRCQNKFGFWVRIECLEHYEDIIPISLEEMI